MGLRTGHMHLFICMHVTSSTTMLMLMLMLLLLMKGVSAPTSFS
jgi:hypothetical protein